MSDQEPYDFHFNQLKTVSTETLENAIKEALYKLVGIEYNCSISNVQYSQTDFQGGSFEISLRKNLRDILQERDGMEKMENEKTDSQENLN